MSGESSERFVMLNDLADEFAERYRRGERPALQSYIDRHPELADLIREFFPAMVEMEQVKEDREIAGEPAPSGPLPPLGRLGDYRIIREIGRGGMGVVYEAEQVSLGRHVALKVLPKSRLHDANAQSRFEREARSAAKLHHTNIVPVFGVGEQDGMPYYVMQFIQGLGLDEVLEELKKLQPGNTNGGGCAEGELGGVMNAGQVSQTAVESNGGPGNRRRGELSAAEIAHSLFVGEFEPTRDAQHGEGPLEERPGVFGAIGQRSDGHRTPVLSDSFMITSSSLVFAGMGRDRSKSSSRKQTYWQSVASVGVQVADALEYAHKQGINHRDIKPSNLLLDTHGTVWVTDFGLAKVNDQQNLTQTGDVLGTLRYMPPEAFEGKTDARSDTYSLGLTLYEMLAFRPAFAERERHRLIKQVIQEEPTRLGLANRAVPRDLATIIHKAIDRDPARRYATAAELAADLHRFLNDEPIKARRISAFERFSRWSRRHPGVATSLVVIGLMVLLGLAGVGIALERFRQQAQVQTLLAADRDVERSKAMQAKEHVETASRKLALALTDMHTSQGLVAGERGDPAQAVLWFANAVRLASEDPGRQRLNRIRARTWARGAFTPLHGFRRAGDYGAFEQFSFHPGGRYLLVQGGPKREGPDLPSGLGIWDLEREQPLPLPEATATASSATWSPDGRKLAFGDNSGSVTVASFPGSDVEEQFLFDSPVSWLSFSPDGRLLAIAAGSTVRVWDCQARTFATQELRHPAGLDAVIFNPRGDRLATACRDGRCRVYALAHDSAEPLFAPVSHVSKRPGIVPGAKATPPLFVADGRDLVTRSEKDLLWWNAESGAKIRSVRREYMDRMSLLDRTYDAEVHNKSVPLLDNAGVAMTLSPSGKYLAVGEGRAGLGIAQLFEAEAGRALFTFEYRNLVAPIAFSPDSTRLLVGSTDRTAEIRSVRSGQLIGQPLTHPAGIYHVGFAPDGRSFATVQDGGMIRVWALPRQNPSSYRLALDGQYSFGKISPDGKHLLPAGMNQSGCTMASTRVYELRTGQPAGPRLQPGGVILGAAFAPDGRHVAMLSGRRGQPPLAHFWDWRSGKPALAPASLPSDPRWLDYSPDGKRLAVICGDGELLLIETVNGQVAARWRTARQLSDSGAYTHGNGVVRFGPDGRTVFVWGLAKKVPAYDVETGKVRYELAHAEPCHSVVFSPDGRHVVTAAYDKKARVWDYATGEPGATPIQHPDWVFDAHFHPDGQHLLTACRDGRARVWDWQSGRLVSPAFEHSDEVHAAAFTTDGSFMVTASLDKTARVWDWRTGTPVAPPFALRGKGLNVTVSPDGRRVVIGGFSDALDIMDLDDLYAADEDELDVDDLCLGAELLSGQRIHEGGGVTNLTDDEWLERWQEFRRRHPERAARVLAGSAR